MAYVADFDLPRLVVAPANALEAVSPVQRHDFGMGAQRDVRCVLDAADQVTGHGVRQTFASDQDVHVFSGLRQKHGCLTRGVPTADDDDFFVAAKLGLHGSRTVINACAFEAGKILQRQAPVLRAGRDDNGTSGDAAVIEFDWNGFDVHFDDEAWPPPDGQKDSAHKRITLSLEHSALQFFAPRGKAEHHS